jgi:hypothetical protein
MLSIRQAHAELERHDQPGRRDASQMSAICRAATGERSLTFFPPFVRRETASSEAQVHLAQRQLDASVLSIPHGCPCALRSSAKSMPLPACCAGAPYRRHRVCQPGSELQAADWRRSSAYTAGTTNSDSIGAVTMPPSIGAAIATCERR